tara:strand:- start:7693 stop:8712 length:1020 start_codon:yes stop_codon:yes gene_type:complete
MQSLTSYIVCKINAKKIDIFLDGKHLSMRRGNVDESLLLGYINEYNTTRDTEERARCWELITTMVDPAARITNRSDKRFEFDGTSQMFLKGTSDAIPEFMVKKLLDYIDNNLNVNALVNFWKHLLLNPDKGTRQQLFAFLEHNGHPITEKGYFLAYKAVQVKRKYDKETGEPIVVKEYNEDTGELIEETYSQNMSFKPYHSGNHGMVVNVGEPVRMPREECDNDPNRTCSSGLHVGSMEYVDGFGYSEGVILEVLVSPRNVVAVPNDYHNTKMRCCEYYPIAITNGENKSIYLESDYAAFDKAQLNKDLEEYEAKKLEKIRKIEKKLEERKQIAQDIIF